MMIELETKRYDDFIVQDGMLYLNGIGGNINPHPCTKELILLLVDFLNMGISNVLMGKHEVYICETQLEYDLLNDLFEVGFAETDVDFEGNDTYVPSVIYGMVAEKLIEAVKSGIDDEKIDGEFSEKRKIKVADGIESMVRNIEDPSSGEKQEIYIKRENNGIAIGTPGYGVKNMEGDFPPILVEVYDDVLKVYVWGDIEDEEPTDIISLEGAKR